MKRSILIAVLVGALAALLAGTALAAGPVTPPAQGFGPGMRASGTDWTAPAADAPCVMGTGVSGERGRGAPAWAGESDAAATLLDMTAEEIQAQRLAGKSLAQIAAGKNPPVSEDELISTIIEAKKGDLAKLVTDGKLTQAQMDLMVEHMQTQVKTMIGRTSTGPMFGEGQGMRQGRATTSQGMGQGFRGGRGANQ